MSSRGQGNPVKLRLFFSVITKVSFMVGAIDVASRARARTENTSTKFQSCPAIDFFDLARTMHMHTCHNHGKRNRESLLDGSHLQP
jgi:hypothetical protein